MDVAQNRPISSVGSDFAHCGRQEGLAARRKWVRLRGAHFTGFAQQNPNRTQKAQKRHKKHKKSRGPCFICAFCVLSCAADGTRVFRMEGRPTGWCSEIRMIKGKDLD